MQVGGISWHEPLPIRTSFTKVEPVTTGVGKATSGKPATKSLDGASSAVAASTHAACVRFRGTDPLVTGLTRRTLADKLGHPDTSAGIPEARWMRAMTFERLVRDKTFASQTATTTVGALGLDRPTEVFVPNAKVNSGLTAQLLSEAHDRALADGAATLIHQLAVPFVGYEDTRATDVKPDFAVVAPKVDRSGSPAGRSSPRSWTRTGITSTTQRTSSSPWLRTPSSSGSTTTVSSRSASSATSTAASPCRMSSLVRGSGAPGVRSWSTTTLTSRSCTTRRARTDVHHPLPVSEARAREGIHQ